MSRILRNLFVLLMLVCAVSSCERRPLMDITERVLIRVKIRTRTILNVTTGIYNEHIPLPDVSPNTIRVIFYDPDTKSIRTQGFISRKSVDSEGNEYIEGEVSVRPGTYDVLCYNFDTPTTLVTGEDNKNTIKAYTSEISEYLYTRFRSRADNNTETALEPRIYYEPDHLLVASKEQTHIPEHTEVITIEADAQSVVDSYYIQIRLKNGRYASDASAVLTDLAPATNFGIGQRKDDEYAATFFEMHRSSDPRIRNDNQEVLCAVFNTFGKRSDEVDPSVESKLYVTFNVITTEGKSVEMTVNMDSLFQTEDARERHWLLIDKVFEIPEPSNSGFQPVVGDWDDENGIIDLK